MRVSGFILMLIFVASNALGQRKFDPTLLDEIISRKWEFIVERVKLSTSEQEELQSVFTKHEKRMIEMHVTSRCNATRENLTEMSDEEIAKFNDNWIATEKQRLTLQEEAHNDFKKILAPRKLFEFYQADREFRRRLFGEHKQHNNNNQRRGSNRPPGTNR